MQSTSESCAEILMKSIPIYVTDSFDEESVQELSQSGIYAVYCKDNVIFSNDSSVEFGDLYEKDGVSYSLEK